MLAHRTEILPSQDPSRWNLAKGKCVCVCVGGGGGGSFCGKKGPADLT